MALRRSVGPLHTRRPGLGVRVCVCVCVRAPGPSASSGSRRSGGQGGELRSGSGLWMDSRRGGMYLRVFGACPEESFLDYS